MEVWRIDADRLCLQILAAAYSGPPKTVPSVAVVLAVSVSVGPRAQALVSHLFAPFQCRKFIYMN